MATSVLSCSMYTKSNTVKVYILNTNLTTFPDNDDCIDSTEHVHSNVQIECTADGRTRGGGIIHGSRIIIGFRRWHGVAFSSDEMTWCMHTTS